HLLPYQEESPFFIYFAYISDRFLIIPNQEPVFFSPTNILLIQDMAKMFAMILIVFVFFASGYEHSIANFVIFSLALAVEHPDTIHVAGIIHNIVPVTLGNIIGGSLFMGALYTYLSSNKQSTPVWKGAFGVRKILNK
ncbi:formate/nitrite transporter family protein, partial [Anoxybacillus flavithermus]|uniref:formate/nitrite transporter family protein n=1 Tax=Anoxybacillus flavithermus TaxID=33934 RepID=UPI001F50FBC9